MGRFTLYDFLSFILPGGTFIGVLYFSLSIPHPTINQKEMFIIPFLVISYLLGHLFSLIGQKVERENFHKHAFWMDYLKSNPELAKEINELSIHKLKSKSFINEEGVILQKESGKAYDNIYTYLELEEKDSKIKTLMAQYGFFRNTSGTWLSLLVIQIVLFALSLLGITELNKALLWNWTLIFSFLAALIISSKLMKQRKKMAMQTVYHTFWVYTSKE
ncbi:CRISPR-associated protein Csx27 [Marinifilum fragile]|uniref:type VI-B CRISPR accessory protein Csx27 n=1 Tax=Marinifilum fragile TaxID=570161 RepID=UPI002AA8E1C1|nr:CRISPR-associated protein Csx27 [Marinifilum fragile]